MTDKTQHAAERFPDLAEAIKQCASDNRFFHGLCEDYGEAIEMLRYLRQFNGTTAAARIAVWHELAMDLEEEILSELQVWNEGGHLPDEPER